MLSVHCRRPTDKHYGLPDYACGRTIVETLNIPVVINGGIYDMETARAVYKETGAHALMCAQGLLKNHRMLTDDAPCPAALAAEYLESCLHYPPPSPLYIRKHLRWMFREELQPIKTTNAAEYKAQFTNWRPRLWTFLVRPYLTSLFQFQQIVHMYCLLAKISVPDSLATLQLPTPTFKNIKAAKSRIGKNVKKDS